MRKKLGVLFLMAVIVIASAGMGISYAGGGPYTGGGICCDVEFTDVSASDNEYVKEVADVTARIINDGSGIEVLISNAYPRYEAYIDFTITNTGCKPIYLYGVNVNYDNDPSKEALDVSVDGLPTELPALLCSGDHWDGTVTVKVTQNAEQNTVYGFTIEMNFEGCCSDPEILNGGFEEPVVQTSQGWDIFASGTLGLGWTVEWAGAYPNAPDPAYLELHRGVNGWLSYDGEQHAELDTDWQGPGGGSGEKASVKISQSIVTCTWEKYTLSFAWSPRPGHNNNALKVYWDGDLIFDSGVVSGVGNSNTVWTLETMTGLTVSGSSTLIKFVETGDPDSLGMFLDAVSVQIQ